MFLNCSSHNRKQTHKVMLMCSDWLMLPQVFLLKTSISVGLVDTNCNNMIDSSISMQFLWGSEIKSWYVIEKCSITNNITMEFLAPQSLNFLMVRFEKFLASENETKN